MKDVILEIGIRCNRDSDDIAQIGFRGELLAEATAYHGWTSSEDDMGTDWKLYITNNNKYVLWWKHWTRYDGRPNFADYICLNELPKRGKVYDGAYLPNNPSGYIPDRLIDEAITTLE